MNTSEIQEKILTDDEFVENELKQFLIYYNLKHTLRWGFDNSDNDETESVAEHVYGMSILIDYFLPFYPVLDEIKVKRLATWHDMAEAIVDDMTTKTKTESHKQAESEAEKEIVKKSQKHLQEMLRSVFTEYEEQITNESKFVKAIDKVEPIFHMYFLSQTTDISKEIFKTKDSGWTMSEYREHRRPYIEPFDMIWKFDSIMTSVIDKAGFFREWA